MTTRQREYLNHNYYTNTKVDHVIGHGNLVVYQKTASIYTGSRLIKKIIDGNGQVIRLENLPYNRQLWDNLHNIEEWVTEIAI